MASDTGSKESMASQDKGPEESSLGQSCLLDTDYGALRVPADPDDLIVRFLRQQKVWAPHEVSFVRPFIEQSTLVFDAGAFIGTFALSFANLPTRFVCIEGDENNHALLRDNLDRLGGERMTAIHTVLGTRSAHNVACREAGNRGATSFSPADPGSPDQAPGQTLKALRDIHGDYDFLKLDLEGAESLALEGDWDYIAAKKPVIWSECNESEKSRKLFRQLRSAGYAIQYVGFPSTRDPIDQSEEPVFPVAYEAALLATPEDIAITAGEPFIIRTLSSWEDLRRALWQTPRWGKRAWVNLERGALIALLGRETKKQSYKHFLNAPVIKDDAPADQTLVKDTTMPDGTKTSEGKQPVFILGDSRTGTTSLHRFLQSAGYNSIHYYFSESGVTEPAHLDREKNWERLRSFIDHSEYDAFSDYPTRTFFRELMDTYPDALFILSTRKDIEIWRESMSSFFSKFNIDLDLDGLTNVHNRLNAEIREESEKRGLKFLDICIDDDDATNGKRLSEFLCLDTEVSMGRENQTAAYDTSKWSSRVSLYSTDATDYLSYLKRINDPSKAMVSEYGWVYLINDSSDFLDYCYGDLSWSDEDNTRAISVLEERQQVLAEKGVTYLKFCVPEKPIIYPEYLPKIFDGKPQSEQRPAPRLAAAEVPGYSYLADLLDDAKSLGFLYFRGDSHANWLGAFIIYHHVIDQMNQAMDRGTLRKPFELGELKAELASYRGDLFVQLKTEFRQIFEAGPLRAVSHEETFERLIRYSLPQAKRTAVPVEVDQDLLSRLGDRETFRFRTENSALPRAVIFRDSTSDFIVDLLAEHFSESLFIWHRGWVYEDVIEKEKPDVVLHIMAERFMVQYRANRPFDRLDEPGSN
ncbi:MAG: FkbM family methyltransferase [Pseudomonadota bacterium]